MQFAATEPEALTNCLTSSMFEIVRGNVREKLWMFSANTAVRSSSSFGFPPMDFGWILEFGLWSFQACGTSMESVWPLEVWRLDFLP